MNYIIRKALLEDNEAIFNLWKRLAEDHFLKLINKKKNFDDVKNNYLELLRNNEVIIYVAEKNNEVIAFIEAYEEEKSQDYDKPNIYVQHCFVEEDYRNTRIVRELLDKVVEYAEQKDIKSITAHVFASNVRFYKNIKLLGFNEYKTLFLKEV